MTRNSTRLSSGSACCHLEWGPSRQLALSLWVLGGLAAGALFASDMPRPMAWFAAPVVLAFAAWSARRENRQPRRQLLVPAVPTRQERLDQAGMTPATDGQPTPAAGPCRALAPDVADGLQPSLDGVPLAALEGRWRGRSVVLRCRGLDGRRHRLLLWPDVTTADTRRELRLALRDREASPSRPSMAP